MRRDELDQKVVGVIGYVRPTANYTRMLYVLDGKLGTRESLGGKGKESGLWAFPVMEDDYVRFTVTDETGDLILKDVLIPNPDNVGDFYEVLIDHIAKNPSDASKIPLAAYEGRPTLGEEILTAYQEQKLKQNDKMPLDVDRTEFVDETKRDVLELNKAFNAAEKAIQATSSPSLFSRDREV